METEKECRSKQIGVSLTLVGMEGGDSLCTGKVSEEKKGELRQSGTTTYYTQGSNPPADLRCELNNK